MVPSAPTKHASSAVTVTRHRASSATSPNRRTRRPRPRRNSSKLAHLSRVAVLGQPTGARAHEPSQPVTAMLDNAQAARAFVDREPIHVPELRAIIDDIINDNRRAGVVIDWAARVSVEAASGLEPVSSNDVVREVIDLAHSEIVTRSATVTRTLAPGTSSVLGDRVESEQAALNLCSMPAMRCVRRCSSQRRLALRLRSRLDSSTQRWRIAARAFRKTSSIMCSSPSSLFASRTRPWARDQPFDRDADTGRFRATDNVDGGATLRRFLLLTAA